ncbi:coenzyme F420-0:L-glutamate ligase [Mesorhizobium sp. SP-1A]|uniref:coenzyme F420-0:L-glutamate ligase n=1 Tax=Mesorhizobium sp. SP-1A TaxID=3077840 RepID=UPI0028F742E9|nr:coenzyme F420-0:L-glutamate ligase [Mesorhizobium sp. SP-1A]
MTVAAAILMKDPSEAKSRLKPALPNDAREALALLLFDNTLDFLTAEHDGPIAVVTRSASIADRAAAKNACVIAETANGDINTAAMRACEWARDIGAASLLVLHADIATLAADELRSLLATAERAEIVIAQSSDGGTNALLVSPPGAIPFLFGPQSAARHEAAARARGLSVERLLLPHLSRDVDHPSDLAGALSLPDTNGQLKVFAIPGIAEVTAGDDLASMIAAAADAAALPLSPGDIVVVAQKIVSKSEGRMVPLAGITPSREAQRLAAEIGKEVRKVEAILQESTAVIRARRQQPDGLLITRHRQGWICANAGIDESNLGAGGAGMLLLLPQDPDASARAIRAGMEAHFGGPIGVVISDTFGRPWRNGLVNVAIGVAGVPVLVDWTKRTDAYGRRLQATFPAFADEVSAAAGLLMAKDASLPVVVLRGLAWREDAASSASQVLRPTEQELFL